jgi:hypothetical protein
MHQMLETVALTHDLPAVGLRAGDVGAVVEVLAADAYEVEFVAASGRTQALVTLGEADVRALGDRDILAVRSLAETAATRFWPALQASVSSPSTPSTTSR